MTHFIPFLQIKKRGKRQKFTSAGSVQLEILIRFCLDLINSNKIIFNP